VSGLTRPGGSLVGTAVDPGGPSGVLIAPSEITQPGGPYGPGFIMETDGAGSWLIVANPAGFRSIDFQFHHQNGVPDSGTRFLRFGDRVISSLSGFRLPATGGTLKGLTIQVQTASANDYVAQLISDPAGRAAGPTVVAGAVLALPAAALFARDRALSIAVTDLELGLWIVRTAGAGAGLGQISVVAEFELAKP